MQKWGRSRKRDSVAGTWTRVSRVRAEYPNQLDYNGLVIWATKININLFWVWVGVKIKFSHWNRVLVSVSSCQSPRWAFLLSVPSHTNQPWEKNTNELFHLQQRCLNLPFIFLYAGMLFHLRPHFLFNLKFPFPHFVLDSHAFQLLSLG